MCNLHHSIPRSEIKVCVSLTISSEIHKYVKLNEMAELHSGLGMEIVKACFLSACTTSLNLDVGFHAR